MVDEDQAGRFSRPGRLAAAVLVVEDAMLQNRLWRGALALVAVAVAVFVATLAWIAYDGLTDELVSADVAVVLGSKVEPDGRPSARLAARLDTAADLFRRGLARVVIVSGATGAEGFDEAAVMATYLAGHGVPSASILPDHGGANTMATARNSAAIMTERGLHTAIVVSQYFHITRARLALKKAGVDVVGAAHAAYFEPRDLYSLPREVIALWAYLWPSGAGSFGDI